MTVLKCLQCIGVQLIERPSRWFPGGIAYYCSECGHEYSIGEHRILAKQLVQEQRSVDIQLGYEPKDSESEIIKLGGSKTEDNEEDFEMPEALKKLLEEDDGSGEIDTYADEIEER